jgi:DNA polymerase-3 subunit gamma/tau
VGHLQGIATKEHIKADETALQLIAQKSEGCMRDALSILDKIVSFTQGEVTYDNTIEHLNILDADYYFKLIDCMLDQDLAGAMLLYDDINKKGFEGDMVLNGLAEFIRNLLICKDERVAGLLEVVESFKKRYIETAKRTEAGYLVSALNILNEAEINFRSARNKRLHVELTLIKLCYLGQALLLSGNGAAIDKKKVVETAKAVPFKNIQPIATPSVKAEVKIPAPVSDTAPDNSSAKLIVETVQEKRPIPATPEPKQSINKGTPQAVTATPPTAATTTTSKADNKPKLGSLAALRQKIQEENPNGVVIIDHPLEMNRLEAAWAQFIHQLKEEKNPAAQSFEMSQLVIIDNNSFEAVVNNNISQRFLEFERNKASEFFQKQLQNRQLQFLIRLEETEQEAIVYERPLSAKEQYQKLIEQFPLVKELRERLKMDLDF